MVSKACSNAEGGLGKYYERKELLPLRVLYVHQNESRKEQAKNNMLQGSRVTTKSSMLEHN